MTQKIVEKKYYVKKDIKMKIFLVLSPHERLFGNHCTLTSEWLLFSSSCCKKICSDKDKKELHGAQIKSLQQSELV